MCSINSFVLVHNMQQSQFVFFLLLVFFFGVKKEQKNLCGDASPKPRLPWRSKARGQLRLQIKRVLLKLGAKLFLFILVLVVMKFCLTIFVISSSRLRSVDPWRDIFFKPFYLHKHKTNVKCKWIWERCSQTLDIVCCLCNEANKKS